ncbi:FecR family protein [Chitinophaga pinensis]|uniref:Anti-FecI sigma factor, FecR n=1 Tax=Chitinophaga pinensis (strain ATCC 43595 / DSM 2588 / LMG 13176 / NBRC 15968 / NCIMB 11800 / UQM 2034) TaxID=485918 RepID=A0A979G4Q4_CHIPD|nr:FecR family protein [Chitinophaga pinensis]ACU60671.1 anti-FecI sigma factor, FecR [Chitinophaga pinensis DSM 2588]
MKKSTRQITTLIIAEITGSITHHEQELLNMLVNKYPQVKALHGYLHENALLVKEHISAVNEHEALEIIKKVKQQTERKRIKIIPLAAAACILVVVVVGIALWRPAMRKHPPNLADITRFSRITLLIGRDTLPIADTMVLIDATNGITMKSGPLLATMKKEYRGARAKIVVPAGKQCRVVMSEGSSAMLNAFSQMDFPLVFEEGARSVDLHGEAYFRVAATKARPFNVHSANATVNVLATEFNVNSYDNHHTRVALFSGEATVSGSHTSVALKTGYAADIVGGKLATMRFDPQKEVGWMTRIIHMETRDENEVKEIAYRYFNVKLEMDGWTTDKTAFAVINLDKPIEDFLTQLIIEGDIKKDKNGTYHIKLK